MGNKNEIRRHYYLPKTVIIAPRRSKRPTSFTENIQTIAADSCVLCHNKEEPTYSVESSEEWLIKSVRNPFGVVSEHSPNAYGYQEVIIESPEHITSFSQHELSTIQNLIDTYAHRSEALKKKPHIRFVTIFKNSGPHAGATLAHAHSQIYAFPFVPDKIAREIDALVRYKKLNNRCAVCDIMQSESHDAHRMVYESDTVSVLCPFASEYPYELMIIPKRHLASIAKTRPTERYGIAQALKAATKFLEQQGLDYNFFVNDLHHAGTHTYIRITPRVGAPKINGGLELSTDITVNSVSPEQAAEQYRELFAMLLPAQQYATAK